jgi:Tfp pilus assembly protein PilF
MALNVKLSEEELKFLLESGYLYIDRREFAKAKEVFEGVAATGQATDVARMGLANVLTIQGDTKEAEKQLREALKANPKNAHVQAQLGELLYITGKKEDAVAALKQAEALDPTGPAAKYARAVMAAIDEGTVYSYQDPTQPETAKKAKKK